MTAEASAYAALGLKPGADWESVERAYKRLIKRHHPDRAGGDARRASEITRAYRELRSARPGKDELLFEEWDEIGGTAENAWVRFALAAAAAVLALVIATGPLKSLFEDHPSSASATSATERVERAAPADPMDWPLATSTIDEAVRAAARIARSSDELALAAESRECHRQLRIEPELEQFDRCAAFDDAVIELQDRDPLRDQGPFSELTVTGRQMSAGTLLSNDSLAIDGRLDRIRLQVELALAPPEVPPLAVNLAVAD
jgi:hypothetical protein